MNLFIVNSLFLSNYDINTLKAHIVLSHFYWWGILNNLEDKTKNQQHLDVFMLKY